MAWTTPKKLAEILGIGPEQVRRRAVKGIIRRKHDGTRYLYEMPESTGPVIEDEEEHEEPEEKKNHSCYIPSRDLYLVTKENRRRPQIVDGWLGRAILDVEKRKLEAVSDIHLTKPPRLPKLKLKGREGGFSAVIGLTDFHFGKLADEATGGNWNMKEARAMLMDKTEHAINTVLRFGQPDEFILPVGSDYFNADTDQGTTTRGTSVDNAATFQAMFKNGVQLFIDVVESLRAVANVVLIYMPGNHDRTASLALHEVLRAAYKDAQDVTLSESLDERQYVKIGSTLAAFHHGDKVRMNKIGALMASEAAEQWGQTEHRIAFSGHLHHEKTIETESGVICVQMPSLSDHDRYHQRAGFTTSRRSLAAYIICKNKGLIGQLNII